MLLTIVIYRMIQGGGGGGQIVPINSPRTLEGICGIILCSPLLMTREVVL